MLFPTSSAHAFLLAAYYYNRLRFRLLERSLSGRAEFGPGCDIWAGSVRYVGRGITRFGPGAVVERGPFPAIFDVEEGGVVELGPRAWLRGKYRPNALTCFAGARIEIGEDSLINGSIISARSSIKMGRKTQVSWDTAILDSNLHPLANDEPLAPRPIEIGDYVMIASGSIVLAGAKIGSHCVVGAHSVVMGEHPDHCLLVGTPARVVRRLSDRDLCL